MFQIDYEVDPVRQAIADSWPNSLDDSARGAEWGFHPAYDLAAMTADMLTQLRAKLRKAAAARLGAAGEAVPTEERMPLTTERTVNIELGEAVALRAPSRATNPWSRDRARAGRTRPPAAAAGRRARMCFCA